MPFAITVANIKEAMKEKGCPVCKLERKAARKAVEVFLYENLMDPTSRDEVIASYGFCPPHTRLMAAMEQSSSGAPVGTNILYEQLNKVVVREMKGWPQRLAGAQAWRGLLERMGIHLKPSAGALETNQACPVCETVAENALNTLQALFEELDKGTEDITQTYQGSDGLCLRHLRLGLEHYSRPHPKAARWLVELTSARLEDQAARMNEFIRKKNWEYRSETTSPEEWAAWREALTFYTGYPGDAFTITVEDI